MSQRGSAHQEKCLGRTAVLALVAASRMSILPRSLDGGAGVADLTLEPMVSC